MEATMSAVVTPLQVHGDRRTAQKAGRSDQAVDPIGTYSLLTPIMESPPSNSGWSPWGIATL